jgi:signal transduction histidine kinase
MQQAITPFSNQDEKIIDRFRLFSRACSVLTGLIGLAAIIGLKYDIIFLKSVFPQYVVMKANAALAFLFTSFSLILKQENNSTSLFRTVLANGLAFLVFVIGFLTLMEYVLGVDLHIDQLLIKVVPSPGEAVPLGRIAPLTAITFIIVSISLFILNIKHLVIVSQICGFIVGLYGITVIIGTTYHTYVGVQIVSYSYASLHAAVNFLLISMAVMFAHPDTGIPGVLTNNTSTAKAMRRITPLVIMLPIILGFLRILGTRAGLFDVESGLSYLISTLITIFLIYMFVSAKWMELLETKLRKNIIELEQSNKELEEFAYVSSHDLQEPLRLITNYTMLLERRYKDKLDADANDFIHFAVDGAVRMQNLINDLLDYYRVSSRAKPFQPVDVSICLQKALDNLKSEIEMRHAIITHDVMPTVTADEAQLTTVFRNLIGNAIKFNENVPNVRINATEGKDEWIFSVNDNGIGIEQEYRNKVFVIFQRLNPKDKYPGSGIGLPICKKIILRHGGKIWFDSVFGKGSTFYFSIPKEVT